MRRPIEYRYIIDVFTPETLPMARLAEYMGLLAGMLGEPEYVHFDRLEPGSAVLVTRVDVIAATKVNQRIRGLSDRTAAEDVRRAYRKLDDLLERDNATARLEFEGAEIIAFPGRTRPKTLRYGPFDQDGVLDGVLVRIGGRDKTAYAHLQDGNRNYPCRLNRDLARQLARHLYTTMRVNGRGRWAREANGAWTLERFHIRGFEVLDERPLMEVVSELRKVSGNGWRGLDDPYAELTRLHRAAD